MLAIHLSYCGKLRAEIKNQVCWPPVLRPFLNRSSSEVFRNPASATTQGPKVLGTLNFCHWFLQISCPHSHCQDIIKDFIQCLVEFKRTQWEHEVRSNESRRIHGCWSLEISPCPKCSLPTYSIICKIPRNPTGICPQNPLGTLWRSQVKKIMSIFSRISNFPPFWKRGQLATSILIHD